MSLWEEKQFAEVEFRHERGCTIGDPYGRCASECDWKVVKLLDKKLVPTEPAKAK